MTTSIPEQPASSLPEAPRANTPLGGPSCDEDAVDVLVVGGGIAGVVAAYEAACAGARVTLACMGRLFSGSSFFPGTWGLGLIAPVDDTDEEDLARTILDVGAGVADPALVHTFVHDIGPAVAWLEGLGVRLRRPASAENAHEAAFIPCFDHKHRAWTGLTRTSMEATFARLLREDGVRVCDRTELVDLVQAEDGSVTGALLFDHRRQELVEITAGAVVLATGGTSGLFERRLTSGDVLSSAAGIAHLNGCTLVNIEFMQMMPGLVAPKRGLVFNEKSFRYARTCPPLDEALLAERSTYGPFTARLASRAVDFAIDAAGPEGMRLFYRFPEHDVPEFVQTFTRWLAEEQGIAPDEELRVALYAHASNGGIRIDATGATGVRGLFACGEATGGMHGADRIGGLSSANGLVFGRRAGMAAARHALEHAQMARHGGDSLDTAARPGAAGGIDPIVAADVLRRLRSTMSAHCMVDRTEEGLNAALEEIDALAARVAAASADGATSDDAGVAAWLRIKAQLTLAHLMVSAMLERRESRGSHFRADYPSEDPLQARTMPNGVRCDA